VAKEGETAVIVRSAIVVLVSLFAALLSSCQAFGMKGGVDPCVKVSDVVVNSAVHDGKVATYCGYFRDDYPIMSVYGDAEGAHSGRFMQQISWRYDSCIIVSGGEALSGLTGEEIEVDARFVQKDYEASGLAAGSFTDVRKIRIGGKLLECRDYKIRFTDK